MHEIPTLPPIGPTRVIPQGISLVRWLRAQNKPRFNAECHRRGMTSRSGWLASASVHSRRGDRATAFRRVQLIAAAHARLWHLFARRLSAFWPLRPSSCVGEPRQHCLDDPLLRCHKSMSPWWRSPDRGHRATAFRRAALDPAIYKGYFVSLMSRTK